MREDRFLVVTQSGRVASRVILKDTPVREITEKSQKRKENANNNNNESTKRDIEKGKSDIPETIKTRASGNTLKSKRQNVDLKTLTKASNISTKSSQSKQEPDLKNTDLKHGLQIARTVHSATASNQRANSKNDESKLMNQIKYTTEFNSSARTLRSKQRVYSKKVDMKEGLSMSASKTTVTSKSNQKISATTNISTKAVASKQRAGSTDDCHAAQTSEINTSIRASRSKQKGLLKHVRQNSSPMSTSTTETNSSTRLSRSKQMTCADEKSSLEVSKLVQKQGEGKDLEITPLDITTRKSNSFQSSRLSFLNFENAGTSTPKVTKNMNKILATDSSFKSTVLQKQDEKNQTKTAKGISQNAARAPTYKLITKKSPKKQVQSKNTFNNLRPRRKNKKYAEFENSLVVISDKDDVSEDEDKNVPIYKKSVKVPVKVSKDIYEFEADSLEKSQSDSDNEYDKEMIKEMQMIKKIEKKKTVAALKKKFAARGRTKAQVAPTVIPKEDTGAINVVEKKDPVDPKKDIRKGPKKVVVLQNIQLDITGEVIDPKDNQNSPNNNVCMGQIDNMPKVNQNLISDLVDSFMAPDCMSRPFEGEQNTTLKKPRMVAYTSDRIFRPLFGNSTMAMPSSPSRANLVYRRGSYMLQTKGDSLPSFNQDVVLNSTTIESHEMSLHGISVILPSSPKHHKGQNLKPKPTKQTSILNFIQGMQPEAEEQCTLFDENLLLSPLKNSTPIHAVIVNSPEKKRALCDLTNIEHSRFINTPEKEPSDVEFFAMGAPVECVRPGNPSRFVLKSPKKVILQEPIIEKLAEEEVRVGASVFDSPTSQLKNSDNSTCRKCPVGIFEDFGAINMTRQELPSFTYGRRRKRVRRISYSDNEKDEQEDSFDDEQKRKRRKKYEMTKKEQEQMNQWAKSFNNMCDEIEHYSLEFE